MRLITDEDLFRKDITKKLELAQKSESKTKITINKLQIEVKKKDKKINR